MKSLDLDELAKHGRYLLKQERTWFPPPLCPREADGGDGPRFCGVTACRNFLKGGGRRGRQSADRERIRALLGLPDHCAIDVANRSRPLGLDMTEVGALMGITRQAVMLAERSALKKVRAILAQPIEG